MKTLLNTIAFLLLFGTSVKANSLRDSTGMPGDNLDLHAVLAIFKDSKNVEEFEKKLNAADSKVNNLDLNHDGKVDYLRVQDYGKDNLHSLVIQDPVSSSEKQDVAVIEVEKKGDAEAHIQIVGDETLYGKNYIIEPAEKTHSDSYRQQTKVEKIENDYADDVYATPNSPVVFVNVWAWPCVGFMYSPGYAFWVSPWYWGFYPGWWYPWAPYPFYIYDQNVFYYRNNYNYGWRRSTVNNMPAPHQVYAPHRQYSTYVEKTNAPVSQPRRFAKPINPARSSRPDFQKNNNIQQKQAPRPMQNNFPKQNAPKQNAPIQKQGPALRYGPTNTGGVRGGGGTLNGGGGMRRK